MDKNNKRNVQHLKRNTEYQSHEFSACHIAMESCVCVQRMQNLGPKMATTTTTLATITITAITKCAISKKPIKMYAIHIILLSACRHTRTGRWKKYGDPIQRESAWKPNIWLYNKKRHYRGWKLKSKVRGHQPKDPKKI